MLRKFSLTLVLLLAYGRVAGQETMTIGPAPTAEEQAIANKVNKVQKAKESPKLIAYGGYKLAEIDTTNKLKWYVMPGGEDKLTKVFIPKGQAYTGWLVKDGETSFKMTTIDASTKDRYLLIGANVGQATLILITNGATLQDEPVVVEAFQFVIGDPPPDPVKPPVTNDVIALAALSDIKAGKGTMDQAGKYRAYLRTVAASVPSSTSFANYGEFYTSFADGAERLIGKADTVLPGMRSEISKVFKAELGGKMADPFPPETRAKVAAILNAVASRMDVLQ